MTKAQISEAQRLFESTLDGEYRAKMEPCFAELAEIEANYGAVFSDCILYLCGKIEMEADERGEEELPSVYYTIDEQGGNA